MFEYLSEEEQYKEILNQEEISRIKDNELRSIRSKYWSLRHKAFIDERGISDAELEKVFDELNKQEKIEIEQYKIRKSKE